jgi:hypothetical protein
MCWLKSITLGFACVLSFGTLADNRPDADVFADEDPGILGHPQVLPVQDDQLDQLRGRLPAPMTLQQVGVVLWDEPRKPLPPHRINGGEPLSVLNSGAGATMRLVITVSRE